MIAVREKADGKVAFEAPFRGSFDSLRFTRDGTQVKYIDDVGNAVFLDASTGALLRYVDPLKGFEWKLLGIIVASMIWVAVFFACLPECCRSHTL